ETEILVKAQDYGARSTGRNPDRGGWPRWRAGRARHGAPPARRARADCRRGGNLRRHGYALLFRYRTWRGRRRPDRRGETRPLAGHLPLLSGHEPESETRLERFRRERPAPGAGRDPGPEAISARHQDRGGGRGCFGPRRRG